MSSSTTFTPKQLIQYQASHMAELQGGTSESVVAECLCLLPETIPPDAVVHDNACGTAPATAVLMEQHHEHSPGFTVHATDINPVFVQGVAAAAQEKGWPVTTAVMDVKKLGFADETFTHTFFTFSCPLLRDGGAAEVYRTLKPGGICIATTPTYMAHQAALTSAHTAIRGADAPVPMFLRHRYTTETLVDGLLSGGFEKDKIAVHETTANIVVPDANRWVQLAWSYLGKPEGGWTPQDEERWDEAIRVAVEELEKAPGVSRDGDGNLVMETKAAIGIATK